MKAFLLVLFAGFVSNSNALDIGKSSTVFSSTDPMAALAVFGHSWGSIGDIQAPGINGSLSVNVYNNGVGPDHFQVHGSCTFQETTGKVKRVSFGSYGGNVEHLAAGTDGKVYLYCSGTPHEVGTLSLSSMNIDLRTCQDFSSGPAQPVSFKMDTNGNLQLAIRYRYFGEDIYCSGTLNKIDL